MFRKKDKAKNTATAFEKAFVIKKAKPNPVVKAGSIVLYLTLIIAVVACVLMAVLDKTGVAPSPTDKTSDKAETVDISSLPEDLQKLYKENFETADFVSSYFKEKDKPREVSLKKYRKSKKVPLFIQWDKQWGYLPYGDSITGVNGDGPMSLAMAGYHLTRDEKFSPDKVVAFAMENGYYNKGTLPSLMKEGAASLGLASTEIKASKENITAALNAGKVVVCLMKKGELSSNEHYVVLTACIEDTVFLNDPTSIVNSEKDWFVADVLSGIKNAWVLSV